MVTVVFAMLTVIVVILIAVVLSLQTPAVSREVTRARLVTSGNDSSALMSVAAMVERWTSTDVEKWRSKHSLEG